eukprot:scaffold29670_cov55-Attheya_sp.AAC.2
MSGAAIRDRGCTVTDRHFPFITTLAGARRSFGRDERWTGGRLLERPNKRGICHVEGQPETDRRGYE